MARAHRDWYLRPLDSQRIDTFARQANCSTVVAQLLLNRGVETPEAASYFLHTPLNSLHSPQLMPGLLDAVERIHAATKAGKKICIYGDYDVDGTTGTAILLTMLEALGHPAQYYTPHRLEEGYGVNSNALRQLASEGVNLVITVDCGIASINEAEVAREVGIELIITDHHEMKPTLPNADVLVHPRLPGSQYPYGGLSGAGVAFKLAWALAQRASGNTRVADVHRELLFDLMGLAALGLVADVVPLRDENRVLVKHGLDRLTKKPSLGVQALVKSSGHKEGKPIKSEDVGFGLGPRINAAGRLGCARLVVELLTTKNAKRAEEIATYLEQQNSERQSIERKITRDAKVLVEAAAYNTDPGIVLGSKDWHPGVVGIVAGRLAEYYARPTLVAALKDSPEVSTGSARSVPGFAVNDALQACDELLLGHGGHAAAAGFKLHAENLDKLRECFNDYISKNQPGGSPKPRINIDAEVPLNALTYKLCRFIDQLEPYGAENPRPRFLATEVKIDGEPKKMGDGERHISFRVRQGGSVMRAVAWSMADRVEELMSAGGVCCIVMSPKINSWNDYETVEMEVHDFRPGPIAELV